MKTIPPTLHKVQYYETDSMRIVHHSNYIRWFEESRVDFLEAIGYGFDRIEDAGFESPVLSINCAYKSMTRFGDRVKIYTTLQHYSGVKMTLAYRIEDASSGAVRCTGESAQCAALVKARTALRRVVNPCICAEHILRCMKRSRKRFSLIRPQTRNQSV